jgi:hypothetical protein
VDWGFLFLLFRPDKKKKLFMVLLEATISGVPT